MFTLRSLFTVLGLTCSAAMLSACGPIMYYVNVASASEAVSSARQAGAATVHTPPSSNAAAYDYYFAVACLDKAREEAGESEYQAAVNLAGCATEHGRRARDESQNTSRAGGRENE